MGTPPPDPRTLPPPPPPAPEPEPAQTFSVLNPDTTIVTGPADAPGAIAMPREDNGAAPSADAMPGDHGTVRIALLLPLHSDTLGTAADSLRAGFMAAYERDRSGFAVSVIDTTDVAQDVLASYAKIQEQQDIIVGPLARSAVTAVAGSALVNRPTIALNYPEGRGSSGETPLPPQMLVMGLSIEDEARQVAAWAAAEQANAGANSADSGGKALILSAGSPWQRRSAAAFGAAWQDQGLTGQTLEMSAVNGYLSDAELVQLRSRLLNDPPSLLFAAMDADQVRQLRVAIGNGIPLYGTSSLNPGIVNGLPGPELDGVRLLDLPWQVQRDHAAVMVYPRPVQTDGRNTGADMERLYALGIDAFRVAREIALHPHSRFNIDGVTGKLAVSFGQGPARFERAEQPAVYQDGVLTPLMTTPAQRPQ
jgi:outer membrane PBP1 activator LpoA protein